jgi:hypothetical protein
VGVGEMYSGNIHLRINFLDINSRIVEFQGMNYTAGTIYQTYIQGKDSAIFNATQDKFFVLGVLKT